jgi:hypothetical protein|tara:strand:- start:1386 stop:1706 length:321 start_codon:yes stop_codon:yes gene_type:complete
MFNIFNPDDESNDSEDFFDKSTPETYKESLVLMVYSQITYDLSKMDVQAVLDWLMSLDEDSLLHFLPKNNPAFTGTRPDLNWFGSVEYTLNNETFPDYLDQTIGRN